MTIAPNDLARPETEGAAAGGHRILISLATFNEVENLGPLVETIRRFAPGAAILVVDDNSPDGTGRLADEIKGALADVHVIHRSGKLGLGTALIEAMRFAIAEGYDYILNLDADFSHPPRYIPAIVAGMGDHDVMIGSRYVPGGGVEGRQFNLKRKFMSQGINAYARLFLGLTSRDNSGSFRCYRVSKLAEIDFSRVRSRGYSFMEEILFWCRQVGCRIGETPILFENRRAGSPRSTSTRPTWPSGSSSNSGSTASSAAPECGRRPDRRDRVGLTGQSSAICRASGRMPSRHADAGRRSLGSS